MNYITCIPKTNLIKSILQSKYDRPIGNSGDEDCVYFRIFDDHSVGWFDQKPYNNNTEITILDFLTEKHKWIKGKDFKPGRFYKCVETDGYWKEYLNSICVCIGEDKYGAIVSRMIKGHDREMNIYFANCDFEFIELTTEQILQELGNY